MPMVNLLTTLLFAGCAVFLAIRTGAAERLKRNTPDCRNVRRLIQLDTISVAVMLLLGLLLLSGAVYRVGWEHMPVFG